MKTNPTNSKLVKNGRPVLAIVSILTTVIALSQHADAVSLTSSGNWDVPSNWSNGVVPTDTTYTIIDGQSATVVAGVSGSAGALAVGNTTTGGNITINTGGSITSGSTWLGNNAGSSGAATVSGTLNTAQLFVGSSGSGTLNINSGGYVATTGVWGSASIGSNGSGVGSVVITSGTWKVTSNILIGYYGGNGALTLNGGLITDTFTTLGVSPTASGSATITSGTWANTNDIAVGDAGKGVLNVKGGLVTFSTLYVGNTSGTGVLNIDGGNCTSASGLPNYVGYGAGSKGTVNITSGTLTLNNALIVGGTGTGVLTVDGGALQLISGNLRIGHVSAGNGTVTVNSGTISVASGNLVTIGNGGAGTMNLNGGTLIQANGSGTATIAAQAGSSGTLNLGTGDSVGTLSVAAITGGLGSAALNFNHVGTYSFSPNITGTFTGGVTKLGSGTTILSGSNSYVGTTTVSAGVLEFEKPNALYGGTTAKWITSNIDVKSGATFAVKVGSTGFTASNLDSLLGLGTASGGFESGASFGLDTTNGDFTYSSIIANPNSGANVLNLRKLGTNKLTLSGNSTYSGTTTVESGTLQVNSNQALGSASAGTIVSKEASLVLNNVSYTAAEALSISGTGSGVGALINSGISSYAGQITATTDATINAGGGTLTLTGGLVKNGTVLTLTGGGVINIETTGISGSSANSDLVVNNVTANLDTANSYNGPTYIRNGGIINANVTNALPTDNGRSAIIMDDSGTGASNLTTGASQSVASLTGVSTSTVNLNSNTLTIGAASGTTTFGGAISGNNGSLVKDGQSTQVLSGTSTYTGTTQVNAGTLTVNGALSSTTSVANGAKLNGSGTISGAVTTSGSTGGTLGFRNSVTVQSNGSLTGASHTISGELTAELGATIAPGESAGDIGTLTMGSLDLQSGSLLTLDIKGTTAGTNADQVITTADNGLSLGGRLTLTIDYTVGSADTLLLIMNEGSGVTSSYFSGVTIVSTSGTTNYLGAEGTMLAIDGQQFELTYTAGTGSNDVELLAVPEPSTWAMIVGGIGMLAFGQRLRRRNIR